MACLQHLMLGWQGPLGLGPQTVWWTSMHAESGVCKINFSTVRKFYSGLLHAVFTRRGWSIPRSIPHDQSNNSCCGLASNKISARDMWAFSKWDKCLAKQKEESMSTKWEMADNARGHWTDTGAAGSDLFSNTRSSFHPAGTKKKKCGVRNKILAWIPNDPDLEELAGSGPYWWGSFLDELQLSEGKKEYYNPVCKLDFEDPAVTLATQHGFPIFNVQRFQVILKMCRHGEACAPHRVSEGLLGASKRHFQFFAKVKCLSGVSEHLLDVISHDQKIRSRRSFESFLLHWELVSVEGGEGNVWYPTDIKGPLISRAHVHSQLYLICL